MTERPRLLDLFCGAGGAAMGYHRAGFDVVGVDLKPQKNFPFEFVQMDALEFMDYSTFDAVHASPPCQFGTSLRTLHPEREYANLIPATRDLLQATGLPYVIENVAGARKHLVDPIYICGSMFDPPMDIQRHRYFEANWSLEPPMWPCRHNLLDYRYRSLDGRKKRGSRVVRVHGGAQIVPMSRVVGVHGKLNYGGEADMRRKAMGIEWMSVSELSQAIPPAYTEFIGGQLLQRCASQVA